MSDVLKLLKSKNRCLKSFLRMSEDFWRIASDGSDEWVNVLALFESRRDATVRALELHDRKISRVVEGMAPAERTPALIEAVRAEMAAREILVRAILDVDLKIMTCIEGERSRLLREMNDSRRSRETLAKFKSTWVPESGEGLDEKL